jgi:hypothetical protein
MNSNAVVLLDTSIQIDRMMGALAQQETLESHLALKAHRFVSTHYVFMEFQRAVLSDYVRVYHALLPDTQVWTIDADFQPIAQALGLSLYMPVLNRE